VVLIKATPVRSVEKNMVVVKLQKNVLASKRSGDIEKKEQKRGYLQDNRKA
jgi:hypothetical protein